MSSNEEKINVILFKMEGCGHCVQFKSTWEGLQKKLQNDNSINFIVFDANNSKKCSEYGVSGFPTIIFESGDKKLVYKGDRSEGDLIEKINNFKLKKQDGGSNYKHKYLKYKSKYLSLKNI
jgi:thiol-disulfide isomerase/thioredoxin